MARMFSNIELLYVMNGNGETTPMEHDDVTGMVFKALKNNGNSDRLLALNLADKVIYRLKNWKGHLNSITTQDLDYMIKFVLDESFQKNSIKSV